MLLGFISLLITVGTKYIAKICIPAKAGDTMLPCKKEPNEEDEGGDDRRKLLWYAEDEVWRRVLASAGGDNYCSKDKVPLISQSAVHQLHIFIFVLAVFHVLYSVMTMALGQAKMKKWKAWELETTSLEYQFTNDPARFRFTHQTSFVRRHTGFSRTPGLKWIVAFFRQFIGSISKVDYLTMRHGFINVSGPLHFIPYVRNDAMAIDILYLIHVHKKKVYNDQSRSDCEAAMREPLFLLCTLNTGSLIIPLWIFALIFLLVNVYGNNYLSLISNFMNKSMILNFMQDERVPNGILFVDML
ncbi:hypothetical protein HHK36_008818 [Tetracentron sinense]|uniref:MLO-like protein n=1 Tax=Tetracentron sinense TaxID=13715 RepID=A0A835DKC8_TETSI|nr:hypothetical protein HHK36_008818 [Tetracentron sinense]